MGSKRGKRQLVTAAWYGVFIAMLYLGNRILVPPRDITVLEVKLATKKPVYHFVRMDEA